MRVRQLALGVLLAGFEGATPETVPAWLGELIGQGLGGVTLFGRNVIDEDPIPGLARLSRALRSGHPELLISIDEEGGDVTRIGKSVGSAFLGARSLGVIDDPGLTRQEAGMLAAGLADAGINVNFAPVADLDTEPNSPIVGSRAYSPDPGRGARHVAAAVAGHLDVGVAPAAKHFPGHGSTTDDSHLVIPTVVADLELLRRRELVPFRAAINAGTLLIMTGHLLVPDLDPNHPATLSHRIVTQLLRQELGFGGVVVTDGLDMHAISRGVGQPEGVVQALLAGVDLMCIGGESTDLGIIERIVTAVSGAVASGRLPLARLAEAHGRVRGLARRFAHRDRTRPHPRPSSVRARARESLAVRGTFPLRGPISVLELHPTPSIVAGEIAWGVGRPLRERLPDLVVQVLHDGDPTPWLPDGAVVVSVRDLQHAPWQAGVVAAVRALGREVVVVDHGGSAPDAVLGDRAIVARDSSAIAARAAVDVLLGESG